MNYLKVYCNLIRKADNRIPPEGYTEKHHTFPVSIYGKNNRVVVLTAREHYIAHALLEKAFIKRYGLHHYKTKKMNFAHCMMKINPSNQRYCNSYLYECAKMRQVSLNSGEKSIWWKKIHTEETKQKQKESALKRWSTKEERCKIIGKNNPFYGKTHSEETKQKKAEYNRQHFAGHNNPNSKIWKLTYEDGKVNTINCLKVWCKTNEYNYSSVLSVHRGRTKNHKGIVSVEKV